MNNAQDIFNFVNGDSERQGVSVFRNEELDLYMRTILNEDGSISVNAEDTAIGFGWCREEVKNGKRYFSVMWSRINKFCKELGFAHECAKDDYIPESLFYMLGMKASNERAQRFQKWLAIEVIPSVRKTGHYEMPQYKQQAKQRDLTKDDYIRAASIISGCRNERLPYVMAFLEQAGLEMPEVEQINRQAEIVAQSGLAPDGKLEEYAGELMESGVLHKKKIFVTAAYFNDFCSRRGISSRKFKQWLYQNEYIECFKSKKGKIEYSNSAWVDGATRRCIVFNGM